MSDSCHETNAPRAAENRQSEFTFAQAGSAGSPNSVNLRGGPTWRYLAALVLLLGVILSVPVVGGKVFYAFHYARDKARADVAREFLGSGEFDQLSQGARLIAQSVRPGVVHIRTTKKGRADELQPRSHVYEYSTEGQGSGVIIDKRGYVLTNNHVISGEPDDIEVLLDDGRSARGTVLGVDVPTDLAVLKIDLENLIPTPWGDSDLLEVGDFVWALGSPFGLDSSITFGIVSAKGRRNRVGRAYQDFLQTDAAVNPGNSGGPLVNARGEIVGINTAIVGDAYQGISFAIPSSVARIVCEQLIANGEVSRGWLGVRMLDISPRNIDMFQLSLPDDMQGVFVQNVLESSPAMEAGILAGDVIVEWDGKPVRHTGDLSLAVATTVSDSKTVATIIRKKQRHTVVVTVGRRPNLATATPSWNISPEGQ